MRRDRDGQVARCKDNLIHTASILRLHGGKESGRHSGSVRNRRDGILLLIYQQGQRDREEELFNTYQPEAIDFVHVDDLESGVLPPTPIDTPIYDIGIKTYDFNPEKTVYMFETMANESTWCRIKPLTGRLWAYYFEDYHEERRWENGTRWNPDFNDVVVLVWRVKGKVKLKVIGSPSTFRNELWVDGSLVFDDIVEHLDEAFEREIPAKLASK